MCHEFVLRLVHSGYYEELDAGRKEYDKVDEAQLEQMLFDILYALDRSPDYVYYDGIMRLAYSSIATLKVLAIQGKRKREKDNETGDA